MSTPSLYDQLGGTEAINAAVDLFYSKILDDQRVNHFFNDVDMKVQRAKQKGFLKVAFGGPHHYTGKNMRDAHHHLLARGLNDTHFDIIKEHLQSTLQDLNVNPHLIQQVSAIAESVRSDVLGRA